MRETGITTRWVNSDRQIADVLTKPHVPSYNLQALQSNGRWKIVFDDNFTSAKKLRKAARDATLKRNTQTAQQRTLQRSIGQTKPPTGRHPKLNHRPTIISYHITTDDYHNLLRHSTTSEHRHRAA